MRGLDPRIHGFLLGGIENSLGLPGLALGAALLGHARQ
jgi:hypothetical protein